MNRRISRRRFDALSPARSIAAAAVLASAVVPSGAAFAGQPLDDPLPVVPDRQPAPAPATSGSAGPSVTDAAVAVASGAWSAPNVLPATPGSPDEPAAAPAAEEPSTRLQFLGSDTIRKPDGTLVVFYRVNFVSAEVLKEEIQKWLPSGSKAEVSGPTVVAAQYSKKTGNEIPPFHTASNTIRIELPEALWPDVKSVLDRIDVPDPQVRVDCKIVEVQHSSALRMGIDAKLERPVGDTFFRKLETQFLGTVGSGSADITAATAEKFLTFDYVMHLATEGAEARVKAMPSVIASQGEQAEIKLVQREPIVEQTTIGNNLQATTKFQDIGLNLDVQPLFVGRNFVRARVSAELSRVSGFRSTSTSATLSVTNPVISTRSATTMVTVPDGETLVLAGLLSDEATDQTSGLPILRDLPLIGPLFGSTNKSEGRTELIFYITFTIERPGDARVVLPEGQDLSTFGTPKSE